MSDLVFWGATGQARVLQEAIKDTDHRLIAIFDNRIIPSPFADVPIFMGEAGFEAWAASHWKLSEVKACVAIGGRHGDQRLEIQDWLSKRGVLPITIVHRTAFVASDSTIGVGSQILAMSAICANTLIGRSVIINTAASVDHCCIIGDGSHIGPGARLAGEVVLGSNVFIGVGAVVLPHIKIGAGAIVGAGTVVTKDVLPGDVVLGNPARTKQTI